MGSKKGHWIDLGFCLAMNEVTGKWGIIGRTKQCSECENLVYCAEGTPKRCPHCGAEMDKEEEENGKN